ncbi:MAG: hypothetical protein UW35_C0010G0037 [Candidatus Collierbacteria bacterium GW2011_GWF2_44_15]|uniref:Uncharacterized protein n=3 Tax=Candidatus Collieribacteriota TaxID=1752725 RepID=A0A0G1HID2_9BACT|nr:MAG: hypothetical protein UW23_C0008G0006 [Candidatus Collierbacteria bacterium GW2011_GWA1_44_12]KKT46680.1 MAG: hypothetical protein UW35_C0010G0037 [Candidatus Collierbacteria bacterium GW2011_GWF2_44_15]KKU29490.1 MAG: hypothetical protein UX41_C0018G0022 [Candidatus Collierbacteria bacterium GW2011_GWE1_46_18]
MVYKPLIIQYSNGKELIIKPDTVSGEILYSPENDHELHYARITTGSNGEVSVDTLCGLDVGDFTQGLFFETIEDGINRLLSRCSYCFMD